MNARISLFVLIVVLAAGIGVWWLWSGDREERPVSTPGQAVTESDDAADPRSVSMIDGAVTQDPVSPPPDRQEVPADPSMPEPLGPDEAIVRGRCVDEDGAPLAGVTVHLHGWGANSERMQAHRLDHGEIVFADPEQQVTSTDGRFAFRFAPPPPYQFTCGLELASRVDMRFRWSKLPAGEVRDVGDVLLPLGVEVIGSVVDEDGVGVSGALVEARPQGSSRRDGPNPAYSVRATADVGGRYRFAALPEGEVGFDLTGRQVVEPKQAVRLERPWQEVRIVVATVAKDERPTIKGVASDFAGAPVPWAIVTIGDPDDPGVQGGASTGRDGAFELRPEKPGQASGPVRLTIGATGYETWRSEGPVAWGTSDLRATLIPGPSLTVRVTRAGDATPVERYGITLAPVRASWSSVDDKLVHLGDHPDGTLIVPMVTPRRYRLGVRPAESTDLAESSPQEIEVRSGASLRVDVELRGYGTREIEVVTTGGAPVTGAKIELLAHQTAGEVSLAMMAMEARMARINSPEHVAELVDQATTDASGRARLRGEAERSFAVRLPGPGHVPIVVQPVRTDDDGLLRIVVSSGAVLRGRVTPLAVLAALRAEGGGAADEAAAPQVHLHRAEGEPSMIPTDGRRDGLPIAEDGTFELRGVPSGTWTLALSWRRELPGFGALGRSFSGKSRDVLVGVVLDDGAEREVEVDVGELEGYEIEFRCRVAGEPRAMNIALEGDLGVDASGGPRRDFARVVIDDSGRQTVALPAGRWRVSAQLQVDDVQVSIAGPEFIVPDQATAGVDVDVKVGQRRVRVEQSDGTPAVGVRFSTSSPTPGSGVHGHPTDSKGETTLYGSIGIRPLLAIRRPFAEMSQPWNWFQDHPGIDRATFQVLCGEVELLLGAEDEVVLRLPAEWAELPK